MPCRFTTALILMIVVAQSGFCAGGLSWKQKTLDLLAGSDQRDVKADFEFKNTSDHPITITGLDTTCGCTLAELERQTRDQGLKLSSSGLLSPAEREKRTYAPGESGRVKVTFEVGEQVGPHKEYIVVTTDEPHTEPIRLQLQVRIPESFKMEPRMVFWTVGSEPSEKVITCTTGATRSITLTGAQSTDPAIVAQVETITPGLKYRIHLKPVSTARNIAATIHLQADIAGVGLHVFDAYAYVNGP